MVACDDNAREQSAADAALGGLSERPRSKRRHRRTLHLRRWPRLVPAGVRGGRLLRQRARQAHRRDHPLRPPPAHARSCSSGFVGSLALLTSRALERDPSGRGSQSRKRRVSAGAVRHLRPPHPHGSSFRPCQLPPPRPAGASIRVGSPLSPTRSRFGGQAGVQAGGGLG